MYIYLPVHTCSCVHACEYSHIHSLLVFLKQKEISVRPRTLQTLKMMKHVMRCLAKKKNLILDFGLALTDGRSGGYARAGKAAEKKAKQRGFLKASMSPTFISLLIHTLELGVHLRRRRVGGSRGGMVAIVCASTSAFYLNFKFHHVCIPISRKWTSSQEGLWSEDVQEHALGMCTCKEIGKVVVDRVTCCPNPYPTPAVQLEYKVQSVFCFRVEFSFPLLQLRHNVQAWCMNQSSP